MKPIDREQAEAVLQLLHRRQKVKKDMSLVMGIFFIGVACLIACLIYRDMHQPRSDGLTLDDVYKAVLGWTMFLAFFLLGTFSLLTPLRRFDYDILVEYLAQRQLQADAADNEANLTQRNADHGSD